MSRPRPPRDRETAPGNAPGADSFAGSQPQGIVRLSDMFSAGDFDATPAVRRTPSATRGVPRSARSAGDTKPHAPRLDAATGDRSSPAASVAAPELSGRPALREGVGVSDATHTDQSGRNADLDDAEGPAYERLFGSDAVTGRKPRRERVPATALQRALGLLTRREHSRKELTRKLVTRGVDAAEVEAAVDKLTAAGWQDDRRFAESLVRSRAANGYGPLHIRAELGTHGLAADVAQGALDDFEGDWSAIACDAVRRRFAGIGDPRQRERKAVDYLMRRGFPPDLARAAARFPSRD